MLRAAQTVLIGLRSAFKLLLVKCNLRHTSYVGVMEGVIETIPLGPLAWVSPLMGTNERPWSPSRMGGLWSALQVCATKYHQVD